ncbi:YoaK family protein [Nocardia mexicana]|uniref:Uncharacterized membrane protein YoaK (UPF0700 family) n=1 Tax=Nocardia mexicana TaxID=279262 RepID=A0A370GM19_9NOCA|nr:YoaK family protein [Nocardia mexicana]RDI44697.1 uncharacterized membrane protein YoaK (UPF0700 family) [Nocardia mexicana]
MRPDDRYRQMFDDEARLSWVLAATAGLVGAAAFLHSAGYFVTFMTGNTERAVLGHFSGDRPTAVSATLLLLSFLGGVVISSLCRKRFWKNHPHDVTVLTTLSLIAAAGLDIWLVGVTNREIHLGPVLLVAFGIGALNTSFVKDGEVSVPLSYVTGTVVKLGQGIARHIGGGSAADWLGYFLLYFAFVLGAVLGGVIGNWLGGHMMLVVAAIVCAVATAYAHVHATVYGPLSTE